MVAAPAAAARSRPGTGWRRAGASSSRSVPGRPGAGCAATRRALPRCRTSGRPARRSPDRCWHHPGRLLRRGRRPHGTADTAVPAMLRRRRAWPHSAQRPPPDGRWPGTGGWKCRCRRRCRPPAPDG
ncbi:hypothetical protein G6F60_014454 [Rhizopus arrhizus]|nr:hypothetical protein G6F60_014454 [Rhizopus arrhizus]